MSDLPPPPPPNGRPAWDAGSTPPPGYLAAAGWNTGATHPNGTTVLVLGILGLAVCGILGPVAWVMGNTAVREMEAHPGVVYSNRGNIVAGRICGIIATCVMALGLVVLAIAIVAAVASS